MLPLEVMRQIRRLQLRARRAVRTLLGGEYHSIFKGTGLSFEEVREYQPGDDVRTIDWNVTARVGHPFVKRYAEERELTLILMTDLSASQRFGTGAVAKRQVAAGIESQAMRADARQTDFCTYLSAILLGGLVLNAALGWWWADPVAALVMVPIIAREGIEALKGKACGCGSGACHTAEGAV